MSGKDHKVYDENTSKQHDLKELKKNEAPEQLIETNQEASSTDETLSALHIIELERKLLESQQREREALLRAKAEVINIRRRTDQDIEKAHKFSLEKFANELLPVIDNLERAIALVDREKDSAISMLEGLELTLKSFLSAVSKYGVQVIAERNIPFNPELHQAMTIIDSEEHEPNQVIDIMQKGYTLHSRLLRPAMVIVSKAK